MKFKDFFRPSFRVMPVYKNYEMAGYTVQVKHWWLQIWLTAQLNTVNPNEKTRCIGLSDTFFHTKEEAIQYIASRKTCIE